MNIVHIAPLCVYTEGFGYQENLLPKYQARLGHNVTLFVPTYAFKDGKKVEIPAEEYNSKDGFRVIRKRFKFRFLGKRISDLLAVFSVYSELKNLKPDYVFFHSLDANLTFRQVLKYKKRFNPAMLLVRDNHLDPGNSSLKWKSRILFFFDALFNRLTTKYVNKIYGVTPLRKDFAEKYLGAFPNKTDVLLMGADDDKINFSQQNNNRQEIRAKYHISNDDFVIISGGKLDENKNILVLMQAIKKINSPKIRLLLFGVVLDDIKGQFNKLCDLCSSICYVGWIPGDKVYDYFLASDLVVFPGGHSVLWEQACACGLPGLYSYLEGMTHMDVGGNVEFLYHRDVEEIFDKLTSLYADKEKFSRMKKVATEKGRKEFSYLEIAKKSIEMDGSEI